MDWSHSEIVQHEGAYTNSAGRWIFMPGITEHELALDLAKLSLGTDEAEARSDSSTTTPSTGCCAGPDPGVMQRTDVSPFLTLLEQFHASDSSQVKHQSVPGQGYSRPIPTFLILCSTVPPLAFKGQAEHITAALKILSRNRMARRRDKSSSTLALKTIARTSPSRRLRSEKRKTVKARLKAMSSGSKSIRGTDDLMNLD